MNLNLKPFAEINLAEQPFQRDSWTQHILIRLRPIVSTTSLALPPIVPTFHEDTCNLHHSLTHYPWLWLYCCLCPSNWGRQQTASSSSPFFPVERILHYWHYIILHIWHCRWMMVWIDPHLTFCLLGTTPSLLVMDTLYNITLFDILHNLNEAKGFTEGCPPWRKPVGRPRNWVFLPETSSHSWTVHICHL